MNMRFRIYDMEQEAAWIRYEPHERLRIEGGLFEVVDARDLPDGRPEYALRPVSTSAGRAELGLSRWIPARNGSALSDRIDRVSIETFVRAFYAAVQTEPRLGRIFDSAITSWPPHLDRMVHFWSAILLAAPGFHGNPMQRHRELRGVARGDFGHWLRLFEDTLANTFEPAVARLVMERAQRIAGRLEHAMFDEDGARERRMARGEACA